jgi:hypothetical protein
VVTYDGSASFPTSAGFYTAKAVVADPNFFGFRTSLISVQRPTATLAWGNLTLPFSGSAQQPTVTTVPAGLPTQVSVVGPGILPGSYQVTAWITDPNVNYTPLSGTMVISDATSAGESGAVSNWVFGGSLGGTNPADLTYSRRTGAQLRSMLPDASLYPDNADYPAFSIRVRRNLLGVSLIPQASDNLVFGPGSTQTALLAETAVLDSDFERRTYVIVPAAGGPPSARAFLRFVLSY